MQTKNPFLDDMAKLATGAAGVVNGMRGEIEATVRAFLERQIDTMELVTREEFDAMKDLAANAKAEAEDLRAEIEALKETLASK